MAESVAIAPRRAETSDLPELARMLARAFYEDPVAAWACRPEDLRPRVLEQAPALLEGGDGEDPAHPSPHAPAPPALPPISRMK